MQIQQANFDPAKTVKVYLLKEERAALTGSLNLPEELKPLIKDEVFFVNALSFDWAMVTEDGLKIPNSSHPSDFTCYPITWLNTPAHCKLHLRNSTTHQLKIILRKPAIKSEIPYDFPRALICIRKASKAYSL